MAALIKTAGAVCGCVLGLTLAIDAGGPVSPGGGPALRLTISEAEASQAIRENIEIRKKREAKKRAAREKALKAERDRLKGTRTKDLPAACAIDLEASREAGSDVYFCNGVRYQAVTDGDFKGYEIHPVDVDRGEINRERARRAKEAAKRRETAKKRRDAKRVSALPPRCTYDANASMGYSEDIYQCDGVLYRTYEDNGEKGFEKITPAGQGGASRSSNRDGGSTY